jgi:two-component system sensor histidine kinase KdpD
MAQAIEGDFYVVYVDSGQNLRAEERHTLDENIRFAENLGGHITRLQNGSLANAIADFVHENHITQVIFGRSARTGLQRYLFLLTIYHLLRKAPAVDVHIVTQERQ